MTKKLKLRIASNGKIAHGHYRMALKSAYLAGKARPGQFVNVRCSDSDKPLLRKPFSFYKINKNGVEILYKLVGAGTKLLSEKKKGENLDLIGPLGNGFDLRLTLSASRIPVFIAGGHGVAPLAALAQKIRNRKNAVAFIGARTKKHLICEGDFKRLKVRTYTATEDGSRGYKGPVTDLLKNKLRFALRASRFTLFACGPREMLKAVARIASRNKIPCQVLLEEYMACGIGTCMGCPVYTKSGYKLVCKDGPVFEAKEIVW